MSRINAAPTLRVYTWRIPTAVVFFFLKNVPRYCFRVDIFESAEFVSCRKVKKGLANGRAVAFFCAHKC
jgi:hypothetical protein